MTTIDERHLNRSWSTMKSAIQYVRRNSLDLAALGHELRERKTGTTTLIEILPIDVEPEIAAICDAEEAKAATSQPGLEAPAPAATEAPTPAAEVLPQHRPGHRVPPATLATVAADAPNAAPTPNGHRMVVNYAFTDDGLWPADAFTSWAWKIAKKMGTPVDVFDANGTLVLHATPKPARTARRVSGASKTPRTNENEPIILRMLQVPGGSTAKEIREALGWKAIAAEAYLTGFCKKRDLQLVISRADRRAETRYGIAAEEKAAA